MISYFPSIILLISLINSCIFPNINLFSTGFSNQNEFAWSVIAQKEQDFVSVLSPNEVPTIYLLANQTNVLIPKVTQIYYWPIDREYKADWGSLNETLEGTLIIKDQQGNLITKLTLDDYSISETVENSESVKTLLIGDVARREYEVYKTQLNDYLAAVENYDKELEKYYSDVGAQSNTEINSPPESPPAFTRIFQSPKPGFVVSLKPGKYHAYFQKNDGSIYPGSERKIVSISPRRIGITYKVIPGNKWTKEEYSYDSNQVIYFSTLENTIFLQPFISKEYNEREYTRVQYPQNNTTSSDVWTWVMGSSLTGAKLHVSDGDILGELNLEDFLVEQLPGSALGYKITSLDKSSSSQTPDFTAFKVNDSGKTSIIKVGLFNDDGIMISGSDRKLVQTNEKIPWFVMPLPLLPLILGLLLKINRYLKTKITKKTIFESSG